MSITSQGLIAFFCSFGVALVALNLNKLAQPSKDGGLSKNPGD